MTIFFPGVPLIINFTIVLIKISNERVFSISADWFTRLKMVYLHVFFFRNVYKRKTILRIIPRTCTSRFAHITMGLNEKKKTNIFQGS